MQIIDRYLGKKKPPKKPDNEMFKYTLEIGCGGGKGTFRGWEVQPDLERVRSSH